MSATKRQEEQAEAIDLPQVFRLARESLAARLGATPNPLTKAEVMRQLTSLHELEAVTLQDIEARTPANTDRRRN